MNSGTIIPHIPTQSTNFWNKSQKDWDGFVDAWFFSGRAKNPNYPFHTILEDVGMEQIPKVNNIAEQLRWITEFPESALAWL